MHNWNSTTEAIVTEIRDMSRRNRTLHIEAAARARKRFNILTIAGMITGPIAGVLASTKEIVCNTNHFTNATVISLSLLSGIIMSIVKFGNFDDMHNKNKEASISYHIIQNNANLQLILNKEDRMDAVKYIEWIQKKYEDTFEKSPLLSTSAYEENGRNDSVELGETSVIPDNHMLTYEFERMSRN